MNVDSLANQWQRSQTREAFPRAVEGEESETRNQHASKPVLTDPEWFRIQVNDVIRNSVIIETLSASEDAI